MNTQWRDQYRSVVRIEAVNHGERRQDMLWRRRRRRWGRSGRRGGDEAGNARLCGRQYYVRSEASASERVACRVCRSESMILQLSISPRYSQSNSVGLMLDTERSDSDWKPRRRSVRAHSNRQQGYRIIYSGKYAAEERQKILEELDGSGSKSSDITGNLLHDSFAAGERQDDTLSWQAKKPTIDMETTGGDGEFPEKDIELLKSPSNPSTTSASTFGKGLKRTPPHGGVTTATQTFNLPSPCAAVRNLLEQATYGHLCTLTSRMHHRRRGYPYGASVEFAVDAAGSPIISLSPLSVHARNLRADPRCTLTVQMPGWSGLANARVTLFGDVAVLPDDLQATAQALFSEKKSTTTKPHERTWGAAIFLRMNHVHDIYFVGGFGTEQWLDVREYGTTQPDAVVKADVQWTLEKLTQDFGVLLRELLHVDDVVLVSIDKRGVDARVRRGTEFGIERLSFVSNSLEVDSLQTASLALQELLSDRQRNLL